MSVRECCSLTMRLLLVLVGLVWPAGLVAGRLVDGAPNVMPNDIAALLARCAMVRSGRKIALGAFPASQIQLRNCLENGGGSGRVSVPKKTVSLEGCTSIRCALFCAYPRSKTGNNW